MAGHARVPSSAAGGSPGQRIARRRRAAIHLHELRNCSAGLPVRARCSRRVGCSGAADRRARDPMLRRSGRSRPAFLSSSARCLPISRTTRERSRTRALRWSSPPARSQREGCGALEARTSRRSVRASKNSSASHFRTIPQRHDDGAVTRDARAVRVVRQARASDQCGASAGYRPTERDRPEREIIRTSREL